MPVRSRRDGQQSPSSLLAGWTPDRVRVGSWRSLGNLASERRRRCAEAAAPATVFDSISWSSDGTRILYSTPSPGGTTVLSTVSVADGRVQAFPTPSAATAPSWSDATDTIAYLEPAMEGTPGTATPPVARILLRFVDRDGRPLFPNLPAQPLFNGIIAWAPNGKRVAAVTVPGNAPSALWIVEPAAATPFRRVLESSRPSVLAVSPGHAMVHGSSCPARSR